jgi:hypothetical protein
MTNLAIPDDLEFVTVVTFSPEINPVRECW